jgi:hypothetical protein
VPELARQRPTQIGSYGAAWSIYAHVVAMPAPLSSVGVRRRAPLVSLLALIVGFVALVLGIGGTLAVVHGLKYHEWTLAIAGAASALAVPLSGVLTLGAVRDRPSVSRWIPVEAVMAATGLILLLGWIYFLTT